MSAQPFSTSKSLQEPYTVPIADGLSVRLYADCRPNYLETAPLQKGLVLVWNGREVIEEGVGFGLPIVKYMDKTFFSSRADVSVQESESGVTLTKVYWLDTVSVKKLGDSAYIDDGFYSKVRKTFEFLYLKHKRFNALFNKAMEIRQLFNVKTEFITVKPRGKITMTYHCHPLGVDIAADFSNLALGKCREVLVLNEQGSSVFQWYVDSAGKNLLGSRIGAWDLVDASEATLWTDKGQLSFSVKNTNGAALFRGWEHTKKRFSWTGLSYSMQPTNRVFRYSIALNAKR